LGSSLKGATHCSMMRWPSIQKDKASISTGLRRAGVCQSLGAVLKKLPMRAEQPFSAIVDRHAPGEAPQPLTLNSPGVEPRLL
jgi:hypothetical protein